jgi:hypothetical protein
VGGDLGELDVDPARDRIGPIAGSRLLRGARKREQREDDGDGDEHHAVFQRAHDSLQDSH